jgi:hypothetical protein
MGLAVRKLTQFVTGSGQTHRFSHKPENKGERVGWLTGFEPATARSTIWGSNHAELQPPPVTEASQEAAERQLETFRVAGTIRDEGGPGATAGHSGRR